MGWVVELPFIDNGTCHVGHRGYHVLMFLLEFEGLGGLETWWVLTVVEFSASVTITIRVTYA